jgi:hypothetical protein
MSTDPFYNLLDLMSLGPERLGASLFVLASLLMVNDLVRTALMAEHTRSVLNHVIVSALTQLPAAILGLVLLYAGYRHPERAWINLGLAALLYGAWYIGGTLTWFARQDTEGADVGWITMGIFITLPCWLAAVVLF